MKLKSIAWFAILLILSIGNVLAEDLPEELGLLVLEVNRGDADGDNWRIMQVQASPTEKQCKRAVLAYNKTNTDLSRRASCHVYKATGKVFN